jgi:hypothetical protein
VGRVPSSLWLAVTVPGMNIAEDTVETGSLLDVVSDTCDAVVDVAYVDIVAELTSSR